MIIIIGPGVISGPWPAADYLLARQFVYDAHAAMGGNPSKLGGWEIVHVE